MKRFKTICVLSLLLLIVIALPVSAKTITIWTGFPELEPFYKWAGEEFARNHPGVNVEVLSTSLREFEQKLVTSIPTGTGPDIFDVGPYIAIKLIDAGLLPENPEDLDGFLKSGAWSDFAVDYVTVGDYTYGLPLMNGSRAALFYNKDMFVEAGLDPDKPPATLTELMEYARKLTTYDAAGNIVRSGLSLRISGGGSGLTEKFRFILNNFGGDLIVPTADGKWKNGLNNEAGHKALQFYVDALHKYRVDAPEVRHDSDAFVTEMTAMFLRESWVIGEIKAKNPGLNYGVAPMPAEERWETLAQPWCIYMSLEGAEREEVRELMKFMASAEAAPMLIELSGWIPEREFDYAALLAETPQYEVFVNPPEGLGFYADPVIPAFDEIQTRVADELMAAFLDRSLVDNPDGIAKVMNDIANLVDSILKMYDAYGE